MKELPVRKPNRLKGYNYSRKGTYFITICAKDRSELFGYVVGAVVNRPRYVELTEIGHCIEREIHIMQNIRKNVTIDQYVIMPNHVHMILSITKYSGRLTTDDSGRLTTAPTVSEIIRLWKRAVSKQLGFSPWQKSFHDHIIRNDIEYKNISDYIENNPQKWEDECFYPK